MWVTVQSYLCALSIFITWLLSKQLALFSSSQIIDQLSCIQAELQESVKELAKTKKKYYDCEQVAHAVREKADIEAK